MEPYEYQTLFDLEESYWWFCGMRAALRQVFQDYHLGHAERLLDAGCGTGRHVELLQELSPQIAFGLDYSEHAVPFWKRKQLNRMVRGSLNTLPYQTGAFDVVISIDVIESNGIMVEEAFAEIARVTKPNGFVIVTAPAYRWLYSREHDRAVDASKRFSENELRQAIQRAGLRVRRLTHLFPSLFPLIALARLASRLPPHHPDLQPVSDIKPLPRWLNACFTWLVLKEAQGLKWLDYAWGSTLMAVAQK
ncbi:MAG: hypothetical protein COV74_09865 [Candidatus Omnitrophica bacterium CG11_big_fil_rev_8_21_14_0_20_45_26]|uniref:Methyltransferase type 11 domain-containing protein n=1 Tax=Candidatus Abzuiibacterium crystallinum TaxID=1974748 RepID=A0A2H0LLG2_9BACT|nr:MAG: hypothetical protein COV74_09865 [Candidatus Omnitrophica bacterium CG11_big_fil_rev_8_21_14_0_20_45_26]PIW64512.1 MAG: hypothetical protein COW12_05990 [Candidatus Omnitrophica bacterium CG12_big_fil_rev_8_21_14_0_65_45_16]